MWCDACLCLLMSPNQFQWKKKSDWHLWEMTPHLFLILPPGRVQWLDESCCMANENGIAGSSHYHTQHGEPDIWEAFRGLSAVANAQHVAHCLEHSKGVELRPGIILQRERERKKTQVKSTTAGLKTRRWANDDGGRGRRKLLGRRGHGISQCDLWGWCSGIKAGEGRRNSTGVILWGLISGVKRVR